MGPRASKSLNHNPKCLPQPQYHASSSPKEDQYGVPDSRLPLQQFLPSAMPLKYPNQKAQQNNLPSNSSSRSQPNLFLHLTAHVSGKKLRDIQDRSYQKRKQQRRRRRNTRI